MSDKSVATPQKVTELTIPMAAQALKVSERTLWRWIDTGRIKSRMKGSKRLVRVSLSQLPPSTDSDSDSHAPQNIGTIIDIRDVLLQLNAANYRIGWLESQVLSSDEQLKLLPDLQAQATERALLKTENDRLSSELTVVRSTWWYKLFTWLSGHSR